MANLCYASLRDDFLCDVYLCYAYLRYGYLRDAYLCYGCWRYGYWRHAFLRYASFRDGHLQNRLVVIQLWIDAFTIRTILFQILIIARILLL